MTHSTGRSIPIKRYLKKGQIRNLQRKPEDTTKSNRNVSYRESVGDRRLNLSSDEINLKPSVANLCTSTTLYRKGFSKQKFDITIYNIQQLICHNQGGENIHWNAQGGFLHFVVFLQSEFFFLFLLIPKRVVKHFYITRVYKCTIIQSEVCGHY